MLIPKNLTGTATENLLKEIEAAATARNLFVRRDWKSSRYGGAAIYTVLRGTTEIIPAITLAGGEGKTPRSSTYSQLMDLLGAINALPIPSAEELPTIPIPGLWILRDADRTKLHELGAKWFADEVGCMIAGSGAHKASYRAPISTESQVRELLESRRAVSLGKLSFDNEAIVKQLVRDEDRHKTREYEMQILARHEQVVREAFAGEQWVSLGSAFPKSANDPLRYDLGARWNDGKWIVKKKLHQAALEIIEKARSEAQAEREAENIKIEAARAERKAAGIIEWDEGEGYGGELHQVGEMVFRAAERGGAKRWYVVLTSGKIYYREDGMSFGVGDEQGYMFWATARPATEEEIIAHKAKSRAEWLDSLSRDTEDCGRYLRSLTKNKEALWTGYTHFPEDGDWPQKPADGWFLGGMQGSNYWVRIGEGSILIHTENTYDTVMSWYYEIPLSEVDSEALAIIAERQK